MSDIVATHIRAPEPRLPKAEVVLRLEEWDENDVPVRRSLIVMLARVPVKGDRIMSLGVVLGVREVLLGAGGSVSCEVEILQNINGPDYDWRSEWEKA